MTWVTKLGPSSPRSTDVPTPTAIFSGGIGTEVVLTEDDGMPTAWALNFDHVSLARKERLGAIFAHLDESRGPRSSERSSLRAASRPPHSERNLDRKGSCRQAVPHRGRCQNEQEARFVTLPMTTAATWAEAVIEYVRKTRTFPRRSGDTPRSSRTGRDVELAYICPCRA